jgi:hypothetical protein
VFTSLWLFVSKEEKGLGSANDAKEHSGGKVSRVVKIRQLLLPAHAVDSQFSVDFVRQDLLHAVDDLPRFRELDEPYPIAEATGPVSRSQSRGFVKEEQIGEFPGSHELLGVGQRRGDAVQPIVPAGVADNTVTLMEFAAIADQRKRRRFATDSRGRVDDV